MDRTSEHARLMDEAMAAEAEAQRAALGGDWGVARAGFRRAAGLYRASWDAAPPGAYGRLIGAVKAAIEAGEGAEREAAAARVAVGDADPQSAPAAYVRALAAVVLGDDAAVGGWTATMRANGSPAFGRAADGLDAIVSADEVALRAAVDAIVEDFGGRDAHLTGVAFADTALMLELLGRERGLAVDRPGPLLPAVP